MTNPLVELHRLGQSFWYDNIERSMLTGGVLARMAAEDGLHGLTSNPTIFEKAIDQSSDYDAGIETLIAQGLGALDVFFGLAIEDIQGACDVLRAVYDESGAEDGYVSLELPPDLANDTAGSVAEAHRLFERVDRPNLMIKVPGTPAGIPAFRQLISEGINVNVTLLFSCDVYEEVARAYIEGLAAAADPSRIASVASFFVSRVDTKCDKLFIGAGHPELVGQVGIANAKDAYLRFQRIFSGPEWEAIAARGGRVQRPLWASTSVKNPELPDTLYADNLIGPHTVDTMPQVLVDAFRDHGTVRPTITEGVDEALAFLASLPQYGIDLKAVTDQLTEEGVNAFLHDFNRLLDSLADKSEAFHESTAVGARRRKARMGSLAREVEDGINRAITDRVAERIWSHDHTVWDPSPEEIANRLGWLDIHEEMQRQVPSLRAFADEVKAAGFRHVVLLGMGGSSLAPEVMRQVFGSGAGYPSLIVLDSTHPLQVKAVEEAIDPSTTLFLVSSKSGGTLEPNTFYRHFRARVDDGANFVAITDPGSSLEALAKAEGFRRIFSSPETVGGRYSALTYFGLVPAALIGLDLDGLLGRAAEMAHLCSASVPAAESPGLWLGVALGVAAQAGRDKVTLICPPPFESFGLWVEQLFAESTGKHGKGLIPIAGESRGAPVEYGDDRLFIALRVAGDGLDEYLQSLCEDGQPVIELPVDQPLDLGQEFWRFEFATTVAGYVLGLNPFDQPNVAQAKKATQDILSTGQAPEVDTSGQPSLADLIEAATPGDYFTILLYDRYSETAEAAASALRDRVRSDRRIATTFGYGPRYLHSTGQLHKGGPNTGIFLIGVTASDDGEGGFGRINLAQAIGDYQSLTGAERRVALVHLRDGAELEDLY